MRQAKKEPIILGMFGEQMTATQREFERVCTGQLNIRAGMFAIHYEKNCYVNRNIQWLWKQFLKGRA